MSAVNAIKNLTEGVTHRLQDGRPNDAVKFGFRMLMHDWSELTDRPIYNGVNVYDRDWDVLVIIDGCRYDLFDNVAPDIGYIGDYESTESVGGTSGTWLKRTFTSKRIDEISQTSYVTSNPHARRVLSKSNEVTPSDFLAFDTVNEYAWNEEAGSVLAEDVTKRAVWHGRKTDYGRLIVHYMQPHFPSIPDSLGSKMDYDNQAAWINSVWDRLATGDISKERVWESYKANLRYVLQEVGVLSENINAETLAISADHGNAFGEWGFYGHGNYPIDGVRIVPWAELSATDKQELDHSEISKEPDRDIEKQLSHLGYK